MALRMRLSVVAWMFGSALASSPTCCAQPGTAVADIPDPWIAALPSMVARCADDPASGATDEFLALALPGISGVVVLTTVGTIVGYRRAKAQLAAADTLRRFIR